MYFVYTRVMTKNKFFSSKEILPDLKKKVLSTETL